MIVLPAHGIADLPPVPVTRARLAVHEIPAGEVEALVQQAAMEADHRRLEREERANRGWRPPFRCDHCHAYASGAASECKRCGHHGATADEGQRTSYARAHARRQVRRARR